jgi:excisionase family DNA binding protein
MLRVAEVAKRLGVSQALVYQLLTERRIPHFRLGTGRGTIRIRAEDVDAYLTGCRVEAGGRKPPAKPGGPFVHLDANKLAAAWEDER